MKKPLIIIAGATATGKSDTAIELARIIDAEIISADSMQVYKNMDVGTAKLKSSEMKGIKHYLIDEMMPYNEFNVFEFKNRAVKYIDEIYSKGKVPIICGGTGFYIQSVLYDISFSDEEDNIHRAELENIYKEKGSAHLFDMLKDVDPEACEYIHPNNVKRVIRALEFHMITGKKISEHNKEQHEKPSPYDHLYFVLNMDRNDIYDNINKRVDLMMAEGLVDEVKGLLDYGITDDMLSMQGLGYKEICSYLKGDIDLDRAVYLIKQNTRHFAKRQITWFKREKDAIWIDVKSFGSKKEIAEFMAGKYQEMTGVKQNV